MWRVRLALGSLLLVASAGCLGPQAENPSTGNTPTSADLLGHLAFPCPPQGAQEHHPGFCIGTLRLNGGTLQEPYAVVHPTRDGTLAVGAIAGAALGSEPSPGSSEAWLHLFASQDGGASWIESSPPAGDPPRAPSNPVNAGITEDPAFAFDTSGTLHLTGLWAADLGSDAFDLFYTSSKDLGRTWSTPAYLTTDGTAGRNWIAIVGSRIYILWEDQTGGGNAAAVAWSEDAGRSWEALPPEGRVSNCVYPTLFVRDVHLVAACSGSPPGLLEFDAGNDTWDPLASFAGEDSLVTFAASAANDSLAVVSQVGHEGLRARTSGAGSASWGPSIDLRANLRLEDTWNHIELMAAAADPGGHVNLLLKGYIACSGPSCDSTLEPEWQVVHARLNAAEWTVLEEETLVAAPPMSATRVPRLQDVAPIDDGFYAIEFSGDRGVMAWTNQGAIDFALPRWVAT